MVPPRWPISRNFAILVFSFAAGAVTLARALADDGVRVVVTRVGDRVASGWTRYRVDIDGLGSEASADGELRAGCRCMEVRRVGRDPQRAESGLTYAVSVDYADKGAGERVGVLLKFTRAGARKWRWIDVE